MADPAARRMMCIFSAARFYGMHPRALKLYHTNSVLNIAIVPSNFPTEQEQTSHASQT